MGFSTVRWLFVNPVNADSKVCTLTVPNRRTPMEFLGWIGALKKEFGFRAKESTLFFWKLSEPLDPDDIGKDWIRKQPDIRGVTCRIQHPKFIERVFEGGWDSERVHILITADALEEDAGGTSDEEMDDAEGFPVAMMHSYLRRARGSIARVSSSAPSSLKEHAELQGNADTAIYDGFFAPGRPVDTIALPVQVFHPVFQQFLDRVNDHAFEPDITTIAAVSQLMTATMEIHSSESDPFSALSPLLEKLLGKEVEQPPSTGSRTSEGLVFKQIGRCRVPLLYVEYGRAFGEGWHDPSVQASYSVRELLVMKKLEPIFEKCCCPCFILSGRGSYLSILGAVFPYRFIVQRLTDANWVGEATPHEEGRLMRLARVFYALRLAVEALDEYYDQVSKDQDVPKLVRDEPHPRFFPHITRFVEHCSLATERKWIEFEYIDVPRVDATNVTFIGQVKSSDRKLVIKFVGRYGVEAHDLLASKGMAPRLLYCGLLDGNSDVRHGENSLARGGVKAGGLYVGPVRMVVMEYVEGSTLDKTPDPPEDTRTQIERAVRTLHDGQFVFGDLREPNIVISGTKAYLIDFDWAGKEKEARYPLHLSPNVNWPEEPRKLELKPILVKHDLFMLDQLFPIED